MVQKAFKSLYFTKDEEPSGIKKLPERLNIAQTGHAGRQWRHGNASPLRRRVTRDRNKHLNNVESRKCDRIVRFLQFGLLLTAITAILFGQNWVICRATCALLFVQITRA